MTTTSTTFSDVDPFSITEPAPLGVGVYGYGGAGKTETALRLAVGIQRVCGGEIFYADTESRKGLVYRKMFPFRYIDFRAPHSAARYIELIRTFSQRKGVLVIDTFTEEHDGEGGMLEAHAEHKRNDEKRTARAWGIVKPEHKKLPRELRRALQTIPIVGTWRAEDKTDWNTKDANGKVTPTPKGEMPIGSRDVPFEMTLHFLMRAGAKGVPCLRPETYGEEIMTKIPRWFDGLFQPEKPITEEHGEALAHWAMAEGAARKPAQEAQIGAEAAVILQELQKAESIEQVEETMRLDFDRACKARKIKRSDGDRIRAYAEERKRVLSGEAVATREPGVEG